MTESERLRCSMDLPEGEIANIIGHFRNVLRPELEVFAQDVRRRLEGDAKIASLRPWFKLRIKEERSIRDKIARQFDRDEYPITAGSLHESLEDLAGVRMIVYSLSDEREAITRVRELHEVGVWQIKDERFFNWLGEQEGSDDEEEPGELRPESGAVIPRREVLHSSGYRSKHWILMRPGEARGVRCELQLRTVAEEAVFENWRRFGYGRETELSDAAKETFEITSAGCAQVDSLIEMCRKLSGA